MGKSLREQEKEAFLLLLALGHKGWGKALMWGKGTRAVLEQGIWQDNTGSLGDTTCQELARAELPLPRLSQSSQTLTAARKKKGKCQTTEYFSLFQHQTVLSGKRESLASCLNTMATMDSP